MKYWIPPGKRKRRRPRNRREDDIRQFAGPNWTEKATDRHQWQNMMMMTMIDLTRDRVDVGQTQLLTGDSDLVSDWSVGCYDSPGWCFR